MLGASQNRGAIVAGRAKAPGDLLLSLAFLGLALQYKGKVHSWSAEAEKDFGSM